MLNRVTVASAAAVLTIAWLLAYGVTVPGGFIKDDFAWVLHSRIDGWSSVYAAFAHADGFYRPIVQLSFGATEALFGTNPIPYALTNLALALATAAAIHALSTAMGLASWAALLAAAIWAFNFHGINMAVVWMSGRTSLFGTLFAVLCAIAFVRGRPAAAALCCFAALLSKEEVLALPAILTLWRLIDRASVRSTLPIWGALAVYLVLRENSGAFGISNAPPFYRFLTDPWAVGRNIFEYADRSTTFGVLTLIAAALALGRLPQFKGTDRRLVLKGTAWLAGGFVLTIWLPIRSSLYVVFPSVGFALIVAAVVSAVAAQAAPARAARAAVFALVLPFLLLPVYWSRNVRWTELRTLSNQTLRAIAAEPLAEGTLVVLTDDLTTRTNFRNAFGVLFPEAAALFFNNQLNLWIEPPSPETISASLTRPASAHVATFRLIDGRVEIQDRRTNRNPTCEDPVSGGAPRLALGR